MRDGCVHCGDKPAGTCTKCALPFCPDHLTFYVDGQNMAITKAAPPVCVHCRPKRLTRPFTVWEAEEALEW